MALKNFPTGVLVVPIVVPISDARETYISLPYGKVQAIEYCSSGATGDPETVTVLLLDDQETLSIATEINSTPGAVTDVTLPDAGATLISDSTRVLKLDVALEGGTTPHWNGAVTIQLSLGISPQVPTTVVPVAQ